MLLLWTIFVIYGLCLACCLVCSLQSCGHLLEMGWPLGSLLCIVSCVSVTFPRGFLGQVWYLIVSIPGLCILSDFERHNIHHVKGKAAVVLILEIQNIITLWHSISMRSFLFNCRMHRMYSALRLWHFLVIFTCL